MPSTRRLRALRSGARIFLQHGSTGLYELDERGPRLFLPAEKLGGMGVFWIEQWGPEWKEVPHAVPPSDGGSIEEEDCGNAWEQE